jgi:uncharacterized damage-inducible protein DinB
MPHVNPVASLKENKKQIPSASSGQALRSAQDDVREGLGECFLINDRVNQLLLEHLDPKVWRAKPPGLGGSVRTTAAIFTHMHNVRRKWLRLSMPHGPGPVRGGPGSAPQLKLPAELDRTSCTQKQAAAALRESAQLCAEMLGDSRVTQFVRDGWARPWGLASSTTLRAGSQANALRAKDEKQVLRYAQDDNEKTRDASGAVKMLMYMVSHEAHHRGQVCMLAHQMGYRLPMKVMAKMWNWDSR